MVDHSKDALGIVCVFQAETIRQRERSERTPESMPSPNFPNVKYVSCSTQLRIAGGSLLLVAGRKVVCLQLAYFHYVPRSFTKKLCVGLPTCPNVCPIAWKIFRICACNMPASNLCTL